MKIFILILTEIFISFGPKFIFDLNFFCQTLVETYQNKPKTLNSNPKIYIASIKFHSKPELIWSLTSKTQSCLNGFLQVLVHLEHF